MNRQCKECGKTKEISSFPTDKKVSGKYYPASKCKECTNEVNRAWTAGMSVEEYRQTRLPSGKSKCTRCSEVKDIDQFYTRMYKGDKVPKSECKKCSVRGSKASTYGMTFDEVKLMEDGVTHCEICEKEFKDTMKCVDHCHTTSKVRGILCTTCNTMLGKVERSTEVILNNIPKYLNKD